MTTLRLAHLSIGDELLDGRIKDGNMNGMGTALSVLGLEIVEARVIPDHRATIEATIKELVGRADIIVTSGGLGPTSDDVTAECIAAAAGTGLRFDAPSFERMSAMFAMRNIPMPESNRRQAMLPSRQETPPPRRTTRSTAASGARAWCLSRSSPRRSSRTSSRG